MMTFVKASCHCGRNTFKVAFPTASLPIINDACHCTSCRHSTGQLTVIQAGFDGVPLSPETNNPASLSNLTPYKTSESATRWFCSTCSAHVLWQYTAPEVSWCISTGALEKTEGIVKLRYHIFVADTLDGGIADHLRVIDGLEIPRYIARAMKDEVVPLGWRSAEITEKKRSADEDCLSLHCHCKTIQLSITRPSAASTVPSSPYPDLLFPYISTPASKIANTEDEKWWLRPAGVDKPTKYLAGHCACTTCRLTSGFEIQSWAFVPRSNILTTSGVELDLQNERLRPSGLRQYKSSPGRNREFCGTCGATVFWWGEERPELIDVSVGLVDEKQGGVRAEGWLDWHKGRVSFEEDALSRSLVEGLAQGLQASV
ncbi:hypothetical protein Hypma_002322 [Hypsizygus marmoreus]|uniref:CENP-V/GFA domain-containing protein n=1 Tax=Hypsizygus marmoreus TaxID=39966 RepID=A0A369K1K5_HYPMA|nr:hypothetical protein Hypma_002322 [Hypsizygus marmoreus]